MSYEDNIQSLSRKLVRLLVIELDYCSRSFGVDPCLAEGTKCYNTFASCKFKTAYNKTSKEYRFCNNNASVESIAELNAKPYIKVYEHLATELHDDKTIPARANYTLLDEPDTDVGIDPYLDDRVENILATQGTFFKKLLERNPNYKGRLVKEYEGFEGDPFEEYREIFTGKIENIKRTGGKVTIECVDLLKSLDDIEYPIKLKAKITEEIGAAFECETEEEMLNQNAIVGDYAIRTDFIEFTAGQALSIDPLSDLFGYYYYNIIAYDAQDRPFASSGWLEFYAETESYNSVSFNWGSQWWSDLASYYRIFRNRGVESIDESIYVQQTGTTLTDYGQILFENTGTPPEKAERIFRLFAPEPQYKTSWVGEYNPLTLNIDDKTQLDAEGYISVGSEIIYYKEIITDEDEFTLSGLKRNQAKSKPERHYTGENIRVHIWKATGNPWNHYVDLLAKSSILAGRIPTAKIASYKAAYTGINMSTLPVFKETNVGKLASDLMNALDAKHWINEEGEIDFKYNTEETAEFTITDSENIILNSPTVDYETGIKTRIRFYYARYDATKSLTDKENFKHVHVEIDVDAESSLMHNAIYPFDITTTWINDDCGTPEDIQDYIKTICNNKLKRLRQARPKLQVDLELKDSAITVGKVVYLNSSVFNNLDGTDYNNKKFEVIKRDPKGNRITFTLQLIDVEAVTTEQEEQIQILENPVPFNRFNLNEVCVTGLTVGNLYKSIVDKNIYYIYEYDTGNTYAYVNKVGATYYEYDGDDVLVATHDSDPYPNINLSTHNKKIENKLYFEWDNMYMSLEETATSITGVTRVLPIITVYVGFPPHIHRRYVDTDSWKTGMRYNVYIGVCNKGKSSMQYPRPTLNDANGKWYLIARIPELHIDDEDYKYSLTYTLPISLVGRFICFDVYLDADLVYDKHAGARVDAEVML